MNKLTQNFAVLLLMTFISQNSIASLHEISPDHFSLQQLNKVQAIKTFQGDMIEAVNFDSIALSVNLKNDGIQLLNGQIIDVNEIQAFVVTEDEFFKPQKDQLDFFYSQVAKDADDILSRSPHE